MLEELSSWFAGGAEQASSMLLAALSHHGRPVSLNDYEDSNARNFAETFWRDKGGLSPVVTIGRLAALAGELFPDAFASTTEAMDATPGFQHRFAGLLMLADWIASDERFFPFRRCEREDRFSLAVRAAENALRTIGIVTPERQDVKGFKCIFGKEPFPMQRAVCEKLAIDDSSRLILIESDTGSGKTEAAIYWFCRLYAKELVDGMYFALPTRVAAREIYNRVRTAMRSAFGPQERPIPILPAIPGYMGAKGKYVLPESENALWDDDNTDRRRERLWSYEHPKRFLAAPVAVGTIDQALLSVLQVKHSLMRSVCLDRQLLVVDEVHASDPYMRQVLRMLLRKHLGRGRWAMLLSATLGESAAAEFFQRERRSLGLAIAKPYPMLSTSSMELPVESTCHRSVKVDLHSSMMSDNDIVGPLVEALAHEARILVVCNTVGRANSLFRLVERRLEDERRELLSGMFSLSGVRCPHHGRFAREDRKMLDKAVSERLGKKSRSGACLLIGTQTLEQSLDIDADWLVTDLAPMDVLLQRLGRLHRHNRKQRPERFAVPTATVRVPSPNVRSGEAVLGTMIGCTSGGTGTVDPVAKKRGEAAGIGSVYKDVRTILLTWQELEGRGTLNLPDDARVLIERTTHPEAFERLPAFWESHGREIEGEAMASAGLARDSVVGEEPFGKLQYMERDGRILTRIGDPTFDIPLRSPRESPFGNIVRSVQIPARWLSDDENGPPLALADHERIPDSVDATPTEPGFRFAIKDNEFEYTRLGLERRNA